jgi:TolB protein
MANKTIPYERLLIILLFILIITACAPDEPEANQIPIARATTTNTAVPTTTLPSETPAPTSAVIRPTTPTPTQTAVPTQPPTTIPLPLPPLIPFPTVTPNYQIYRISPDSFAQSIFLQIEYTGGDGAIEQTPSIIIYSDGKLLLRESGQYWESQLTALEMCTLRQQIEATGFLEPRNEEAYYTQRSGGDGAGYLTVLIEDIFYSFYDPDIPYLVEDLASGLEFIQNYRPAGPMTPYIPNAYVITIYENMYPEEDVPDWPSELPPLSELWPDRSQTGVFVLEGEWASVYHDLLSTELSGPYIRDDGQQYIFFSRPIMPHETPYHLADYSNPPEYEYIQTFDCGSNPAFIPTPTPTSLPSHLELNGQGRITFVSEDIRTLSQEIFISEADGTNRLQLTNNRDFDGEPTWSPDGQKIAFTSFRNGNKDIFVMDANGRNVIQLTTHEADDLSPTWSPDGTKIAFTSQRHGGLNDTEIYLINPDGSGEEQLTTNQFREYRPVWSPDGRKIAFILQEALFGEKLALLSLETGEIEVLMSENFHSISRPTWSPDSSQVAIAIDSSSQEVAIHIINVENGTIEQQIPLLTRQLPGSLDWSADGNFLLFDAWEQYQGDNQVNYSESTAHLGSWNLYTFNTTTNQIIQITYNQQDELSPSWWP